MYKRQLLEPGDTILAMRLDQGGHLTHGSPASITSKWWNFVSYGVTPRSDDPENPGEIDVYKRQTQGRDRWRRALR